MDFIQRFAQEEGGGMNTHATRRGFALATAAAPSATAAPAADGRTCAPSSTPWGVERDGTPVRVADSALAGVEQELRRCRGCPSVPGDVQGLVVVGNSSHSASARKAW